MCVGVCSEAVWMRLIVCGVSLCLRMSIHLWWTGVLCCSLLCQLPYLVSYRVCGFGLVPSVSICFVFVALPYRCDVILCCFFSWVVTVSRSCFCLLISRVTTFVAKRNHPAADLMHRGSQELAGGLFRCHGTSTCCSLFGGEREWVCGGL